MLSKLVPVPPALRKYIAHGLGVSHEVIVAIAAEERGHLLVAIGLAAVGLYLLVLASQLVAASPAAQAVAEAV